MNKNTQIISLIKLTSLHLFAVLRHVVRSNRTQEFDVVVAVVLGHLLPAGFVWTLKRRGQISYRDATRESGEDQSFERDALLLKVNIHISPSFCRGHS